MLKSTTDPKTATGLLFILEFDRKKNSVYPRVTTHSRTHARMLPRTQASVRVWQSIFRSSNYANSYFLTLGQGEVERMRSVSQTIDNDCV